jgi:hypothetical protein
MHNPLSHQHTHGGWTPPHPSLYSNRGSASPATAARVRAAKSSHRAICSGSVKDSSTQSPVRVTLRSHVWQQMGDSKVSMHIMSIENMEMNFDDVGFSNTTTYPEGILSRNNRKSSMQRTKIGTNQR